MADDTLEHMIARFRVQAGYRPSAREIFGLAQGLKALKAEFNADEVDEESNA